MSKTIFYATIASLLLSVTLTSCLNSNDETTEVSDECAITAVTLGTLNRTIKTQTTSGRDTSYVTTIYGGLYPMYIDQFKHEIYNADSLPVGTDVKHVIFTSISGDGTLAYRLESGTDTLFTGKDSLDFTKPRYFSCYASSGNAHKTYLLHVNVHQVDPNIFKWSLVSTGATAFSAVTSQKAFVREGTIYVFALSEGVPVLLTSATTDGASWTKTSLPLATDFDPHGVQMLGNKFYAVSGAQVMTSSDGLSWTNLESNLSPTALVAASSQFLFAWDGGGLYESRNGVDWQKDSLDDSSSLLPTSNFTSACMPMSFSKNFEYVLFAGKNVSGSKLWKKTIDINGENSDIWSYYPSSDEVTHPFPDIKSPTIIEYDDKMLTLGCVNDTLSLFYVSKDAGRNWIADKSSYKHPAGIQTSNFSCAVDADNYIWIICGGTGVIWKGRINSLSFAKKQTSFTE